MKNTGFKEDKITTDILGLSQPLTKFVQLLDKMYEPTYIKKMAKARKVEKEILELGGNTEHSEKYRYHNRKHCEI